MVVVLTSGLVWDGRSEEPAEAELSVDDGRITAVAVPSRTRPTDDDPVVDLAGSVVSPHIIDMHVQPMWSGGPAPVRAVEQTTPLRSAADAQVQPLARVTTVPDVATTHEQSGAHAQR
jgi:predicted amidohydrolase YtcJ